MSSSWLLGLRPTAQASCTLTGRCGAVHTAGVNVAADPSDNRYFTFLSSAFDKPTNATTDYSNVAAAIKYIRAWKAGEDPPVARSIWLWPTPQATATLLLAVANAAGQRRAQIECGQHRRPAARSNLLWTPRW